MFSDTTFQIMGGLFYLLNKIFFSRAERCADPNEKRMLEIAAWICYLAGMPFIVDLFVSHGNLMASSIEASGGIIMLYALILTSRNPNAELPRWLNIIPFVFATYGISASAYRFAGIGTLTQFLELGTVCGFLLGIALRSARSPLWHPSAYVGFAVMNISTCILFLVQGMYIMTIQQVISLGFVVDAFVMCRKRLSKPHLTLVKSESTSA